MPFPHRGDTSCPEPIRSGCPASTQQQLPQPGYWCLIVEPSCPRRAPFAPKKDPPGGPDLVATNGARTCVPGPLAGAGAPRAGNTLITLEVTGLRGGLKRNWLLFTDTIWTQPTASPFSAKSPTRGTGVGVTPDPARSVPSPVLVWPVPRIPSSQRQRGEYCLRQGILTSPQCQPSAEPGNASLEPQGPCAACPAPREGDAGAEPAGTRWVQASLEPAVWEQPSLRLSCRPRHRHAGPGTGGTAVPVGLSFAVPQGWLTGDSRPRPRC